MKKRIMYFLFSFILLPLFAQEQSEVLPKDWYDPIAEIRRVFQSVKLTKDCGRMKFMRNSKFFYAEYAVTFMYYWYQGKWPTPIPNNTCFIVTNSDINGFEHAFVCVLFPAGYTESGKDEWVCIEAQACNYQKDWPSSLTPKSKYETHFKFSKKNALADKTKYAFIMENSWEKYNSSLNNYGNTALVLEDAPEYIKTALDGKFSGVFSAF